jgi:opacity protein-like surface antigen
MREPANHANLMVMRRSFHLFCTTVLLSVLAAFPAAAQTPDAGAFAIGGDIGALFPDAAFEKALTVDGYGEYYVTPRVSVRGLLNWASPGFKNRTEDHFRQTKLLFNGAYNWDQGGAYIPFVTVGAGFYFVREILDAQDDPDSETRGGINFGGGVEYFLGERASFKTEVRWDFVSHPPALPDASGFTLTFGYKRYF